MDNHLTELMIHHNYDMVANCGAGLVPQQAATDAQLVTMWLDGRSASTARAYGADAAAFMVYVGKPLRSVTVGDVQGFGKSLNEMASASRARKLSRSRAC